MNLLKKIYRRLFSAFGPQYWWPGDTVEEIIAGAVLTQNTSWQNVEKALNNLKNADAMSFKKISRLSKENLASLLQPSGYYNIKEKRLRSVAEYFIEICNCDFKQLENIPLKTFRENLLNVHGVGKETADSILLYAFSRPVFVIDAYTLRFCRRHGILEDNDKYEKARLLFEASLEKSVPLYNEYHALIVKLGKEYCKTKASCTGCPLNHKECYSSGWSI
jgi:endonuclease III related protein